MLEIAQRVLAGIVMSLLAATVQAGWTATPADGLQQKSAAAVSRFRERVPATGVYFDDAVGYAVFPTIGRAAAGFGAAYGRGIVVAGDEVIGRSGYWQLSSGIQLGVRGFSMIVFFRTPQDLARFRSGGFEFTGQAGLAIANSNLNATPSYSEGVAIFALSKLGLMAELSYSFVRFTFRPVAAEPAG